MNSSWIKYKKQLRIYSYYWTVYGGPKSLLSSFYLHLSLVITALSFNIWMNSEWWALPLSMLPNILGFSLGGFAILISFGNENFTKALLTIPKNKEFSAYENVASAFAHFIIIQILAMIFALLAKSFYFAVPSWLPVGEIISCCLFIFRTLFWFVGYLLFVYALMASLAATMRILRLARVFTKSQNQNQESPVSSSSGE